MKQVFKVGTIQYFTYTIPAFFRKNVKVSNYWVIRNVKYIYSETEEEAKEKYKDWFFKEYNKIISGGGWYLESDGVPIDMYEEWADIISTEIIVLDDKYDNSNYETYKSNMQANDFKEWWFDNGRCNYIP